MRSRLISLGHPDEFGIADLAKSAWNKLSIACHYHAYELSPSAVEIRVLIDQVAEIAAKAEVTGTAALQGQT